MIAIIGSGISGLSAAYFLQIKNIKFILFEENNQSGGYIQTTKSENYILENGPNSILSDDETLDFIKELGLENEILFPNSVANDRYICKNAEYKSLPTHPLKLLFSNFFSISTKIKIIKDLFSKPEFVDRNISVKDFFIKYFGTEITEYAVDPFMSGVYAGDISKMKLSEIMPDLIEYKTNKGSIIKSLIKNAGKRKKSHSFKNGLQTLTDALYEKVKPNIINEKVIEIKSLSYQNIKINTISKSYNFTSTIISIPAFKLADIQGFEQFKNINYAPMAVVHSVFNKKDIKHPLNGFGGLNPSAEHCFSLGSIWSSSIFENRCPENEVLFTTFVGGMKNKEKCLLTESEIKLKVNHELINKFKINSSTSIFQHFCYWKNAIPQYDENYVALKSNILELETQNIYICSNWHGGISLVSCIKKAKNIVNKLSN